MRQGAMRLFIVLVALLLLPVIGYAQEATLIGTVTDSSGGVLPGVTVTAVLEATGNTFPAITDARGTYRLPVRIGTYRISAELAGFRTVTRTGVELLVGRQAVVNLEMPVSSLEESVTVTGATPLVDLTQSTLSGNIDARQMKDLPVNGRNWMDLSIMAPGSRTNSISDSASTTGTSLDVSSQIHVDGQQITSFITAAGWGQPRFSRDAIAEFEFVSSRFDATAGRSSGVQVNAVTKSGTNTFAGTASGYFRNDRFNDADFVVGRVLPYSNQQASFTFGGPLVKDRAHLFGYYEQEREPRTFNYKSIYPSFNIADVEATKATKLGGGRFDMQLGGTKHLMARASAGRLHEPYRGGGVSTHPSTASQWRQPSNTVFMSLTQTLGGKTAHEISGGLADNTGSSRGLLVTPPNTGKSGCPWDYPGGSPQYDGECRAPLILLRGYTIGGARHTYHSNSTWSLTDKWSTIRGAHSLKLGGEYLYYKNEVVLSTGQFGEIDATGGAVPTNIQALFPVWDDVTTWNLAALSKNTVSYLQRIGRFDFKDPRHYGGAWLQDDWAATSRLTLNLGVRYDICNGCLAEGINYLPMKPTTPTEKAHIAPRVGFAYSLPGQKTVFRGGYGIYYSDVTDQITHHSRKELEAVAIRITNDGRPNFAADPFNGKRVPTYDEIQASGTAIKTVGGGGQGMASPTLRHPYSHQTSIGLQRQISQGLGFEADYVWTGSRNQLYDQQNVNLSFNPATGTNYPFTDVSKRPIVGWDVVGMRFSDRRANYQALQTSFTKRFSHNWQASATYTLGAQRDSLPPPRSYLQQVQDITLAPQWQEQYGLAAGDQRHRAVVNGIWALPYRFQLSGTYFYGSGARSETTCGCGDPSKTGISTGNSSLRANGTVIPRNNFVGDPLHRVDLRLMQQVSIGARVKLDGILEAFNLFNHVNYGSYTLVESNSNYGKAVQSTELAYAPRMLQLGFRLAF